MLWLRSPSSEVWLERRTTYARSLALMSMVGYVLGLGDRHPSNLMLDRLSGQVVHIDFGDCFDVAVLRDKFPERVPFRLTRMLVNAMEVSGVEGTYRGVCESVLSVLRANTDSVMTMLEAFVHDPLVNWEGIKTKEADGNGNDHEGGGVAGAAGTGGAIEDGQDEDEDSSDGAEQTKGSALREAMESAIAEGAALDLMRRQGISHIRGNAGGSLRRTGSNLRDNTRFAPPAPSSSLSEMSVHSDDSDGEKDDDEDGVFEEHLNERAVAVLARVREKLTGRDRIAYRIGGSGSISPEHDEVAEESVSAFDMNEELGDRWVDEDEPLDVATQVDRLVKEAVSHENLSQNYLGWCAFW
jgi:phosphatidylinositol kinase/protein kinase (PI-3  family)